MKKIKYVIGIIAAIIAFSSCVQEIEKNSGVTDPVIDPAKTPTGVVTGDVVKNLGNSATFAVTVGGDNGSELKDVGVILSKNAVDFTLTTPDVLFSSGTTPQIGENEVTVRALSIGTDYYYRAYSMNANGISYGEIKSFTTLAVFFTPYTTDFSDKPGARDYWTLDEFTGYGDDDYVWWFNPTDAGAPASWGQSIAAYSEGTPDEIFKIISPQISIAANDTLGFYFYVGLFGGPSPTKIKVYITEDLDNLGTPVKDWSFAATNSRTAIPMDAYVNKMVYVVWVIEQGDVFFYHFSIANTTDVAKLFP